MWYKKPDTAHILCEHGRATSPRLPAEFGLCVWNFHKCKDKGWEKTFLSLSQKTDIFAAQEVIFSQPVTKILTSTPFHWNGAVSFLSLRGKIPTGIATGATVNPIRVAYKAAVKEPFLNLPKMTMSVLYPIEKTFLLLVNIHAINFKGNKAFEQNLLHAAALLEKFTGPVIIAGDFNAWSKTRLAILSATVKRLGLREVPFSPDLRTHYLGRAVDFIFTRGLQTVSTQVIPTRASDHNALLVSLRLL